MKKRLLAILIALVLCFSVVAVVACNPSDSEQGGGGNNGAVTLPDDLPTEEGKVTFAVYVDYDLPSGVSPFLTGSIFTNWGNGLEMKKHNDTKFYYVIVDDFTDQIPEWENNENNDYNDYKLVLGFNSESGYGENKQGNQGRWIEADQYIPDNGQFEWVEGQQIVNLGTATWESKGGQIGEPYRLSKVTLRVVIETELGENAQVVIKGEWDNNVEHVATRSEKVSTVSGYEKYSVWEVVLQDIMDTNYGYSIVITKDTTAAEKEVITVVNSHNEGELLFVEFNSSADNWYIDLAGTNAFEEEESEVYLVGLDLSQASEGKLDIYKPMEITLRVEFTTALAEGYTVWLIGDGELFGAWGSANAIQFTSTDRKVWTATISIDENLLGTTSAVYKVSVVQGEAHNWDGTNYGEGGDPTADNAPGFTFAAEVDVFGDVKLVFPA